MSNNYNSNSYSGFVIGASADSNIQQSYYDVCIIGAGPSGVQAAYTLDEGGYSTAILEKNNYIGGKTKTINYNGYRYRMGAILHSQRKAHSVQSLLNKFNITQKISHGLTYMKMIMIIYQPNQLKCRIRYYH